MTPRALIVSLVSLVALAALAATSASAADAPTAAGRNVYLVDEANRVKEPAPITWVEINATGGENQVIITGVKGKATTTCKILVDSHAAAMTFIALLHESPDIDVGCQGPITTTEFISVVHTKVFRLTGL